MFLVQPSTSRWGNDSGVGNPYDGRGELIVRGNANGGRGEGMLMV